ncbi:alpha/beta hydrolase family protein [Zestomonas carbonaria]|uniref:DUF3530 family protein n=1 Tax=Zestomonas carbonaria TaxID=2762745 RepID=A0A7U7EL35_9GAMM|nr:alpha/beta hydrolase family protein [Pseudomonas carbonaria]CAD5106999.1 hypothetical protein PSEWESI4_01269 [Pseudomonas carbonaria]
MRHCFRSRLPALCLLLLLPGIQPVLAEEPPTDEAPPAAPERPASERSADVAAVLEQRLPADEQQRLQAGEEDFLALWRPANVGEPSGVVILLPGDDESADWPQAIGPLRRKLPDSGWHTLSLTLPDPQDTLPPRPAGNPATAEEAPAEAADSEEPAQDGDTPAADDNQREAHAARVLARIQAGIEFAEKRQPTSIVLLGHGSGTYWAARYLTDQPSPRIHNLLLVAARMPDGFGPPLEQLIPELKLATGDFYYKDNPAARDTAIKRMQEARRQRLPAYIQVAMKALPGNPAVEQEQLYRRIKGWLTLHLRAKAQTAGEP